MQQIDEAGPCGFVIARHLRAQDIEPGNKGKLVGQKAPFKLKEIWANRVRLHLSELSGDLNVRIGSTVTVRWLRMQPLGGQR